MSRDLIMARCRQVLAALEAAKAGRARRNRAGGTDSAWREGKAADAAARRVRA